MFARSVAFPVGCNDAAALVGPYAEHRSCLIWVEAGHSILDIVRQVFEIAGYLERWYWRARVTLGGTLASRRAWTEGRID